LKKKRERKEKAKPSLLPSLSYPPLHLNKQKPHSKSPHQKVFNWKGENKIAIILSDQGRTKQENTIQC